MRSTAHASHLMTRADSDKPTKRVKTMNDEIKQLENDFEQARKALFANQQEQARMRQESTRLRDSIDAQEKIYNEASKSKDQALQDFARNKITQAQLDKEREKFRSAQRDHEEFNELITAYKDALSETREHEEKTLLPAFNNARQKLINAQLAEYARQVNDKAGDLLCEAAALMTVIRPGVSQEVFFREFFGKLDGEKVRERFEALKPQYADKAV